MAQASPRKVFSQERPGYADVGEVESVARELDDKHLLCRELQHNWLPYGTPGRYRDGGFQRVIRCQRCKTEKHMEIDARGMTVSSHYVYAEGYLVEGLGRIAGEAKGALRLASIFRAVEKPGARVETIERKPKRGAKVQAEAKTESEPVKTGTAKKSTPKKRVPPKVAVKKKSTPAKRSTAKKKVA